MSDTTDAEAMRSENDRLRRALSACVGYLITAKFDLKGDTPKRTAIATIEGGIRQARKALKSAGG